MPNEKLEKLRHKQYVAERKLTADIVEATKHGKVIYEPFPAEWCDFAGYGIFDQPDGAAAGCDLAAGQGTEFEICDPGLGMQLIQKKWPLLLCYIRARWQHESKEWT